MHKIKKYFGEWTMSWKKVILFALITAVYTALINQVTALEGTSFRDIAVNLECWILFAMLIIINCEKWWEASLKCFVFFLISQPLIFLIEVPFSADGFGLFRYYPYWLVITVLTLPGAAIAWLVRRKDWIAMVVLSVANCYLAWQGIDYFRSVKGNFPRHLLSTIFCIALPLFFIWVLLHEKKHRAVAILIFVVALAGSLFITRPADRQELDLGEGNWTCAVEEEDIVSVEITDGCHVTFEAGHDGSTLITFTDDDGNTQEVYATVGAGSIYLNMMDKE